MGKSGFVYLLVIFMLPLFSCLFRDDPGKVPLAKVGDKTLYLKELASIIPDDLGKEDSILLAEDYIKKWITTELLIKKAVENLTVSQRDVSKELEEYKNSLITYRYKKELMAEKMDTLVTTAEISDFYKANENNFILANDIIKAIFMRIPLEDPLRLKALEICKKTKGEELAEIRNFACGMPRATIFMLTTGWMPGLYCKICLKCQLIRQDILPAVGPLKKLMKNITTWFTFFPSD